MNAIPLTVLVAAIPLALAAVLAAGCNDHRAPDASPAAEGPGTSFVGRVYDDSGNLRDPETRPRIVRSDAQWRARLTPDQYRILREGGTERAFTGVLLGNSAEGVYRCAGCDLPLFSSETKFKSGTGWPSFHDAIADGNVAERTDRSFGMVRTEIHCGRCEGHLGHVFPDGPPPTGRRYCVNSLSLAFTPTRDIATLEEPATMDERSEPSTADTASAVFAGGCFWCVEAVFEELEGVKEVTSGYAGGSAATANYEAVCAGHTGHAEAVRIVYDPSKIAYDDLLRVHFATHDPTTLNRQGADSGTQYRSAIFHANEREKTLARAFIDDLNDQQAYGDRRVVTTLEPLTRFHPAEPYHQNYVCRNPLQPYVRGVAMPKVQKVRKQFKAMLKRTSALDQPDRD